MTRQRAIEILKAYRNCKALEYVVLNCTKHMEEDCEKKGYDCFSLNDLDPATNIALAILTKSVRKLDHCEFIKINQWEVKCSKCSKCGCIYETEGYGHDFKYCPNCARKVKNDKVNHVNDTNSWTPVSEGLPDEHEETRDIFDSDTLAVVDCDRYKSSEPVNVTVWDREHDEIYVACDCTIDGEWGDLSETYEVIAWMPLSKPYKPKLPKGDSK